MNKNLLLSLAARLEHRFGIYHLVVITLGVERASLAGHLVLLCKSTRARHHVSPGFGLLGTVSVSDVWELRTHHNYISITSIL
jgi:hypothetical protein